MRLGDIAAFPIPPGAKGIPLDGSVTRLNDLAGRGLNLLRGDLPMPVAILKRAALDHNVQAMQAYAARAGVRLAPHAKTTMCPQLLFRQLEAGAWGLTVATMSQLLLCHRLGVENIILANQLVGRAEIAGLAALMACAPDRAVYFLVDSLEGARAISEGFQRVTGAPDARALIEVGMPGGRCGVRTRQDGVALARALRALPGIALHGIEGYEGLVGSEDGARDAAAVTDYLATLIDLYDALRAEALFAESGPILLSAGGSAYYDLVALVLSGRTEGAIPILRSGCYVTHDSGFYQRHMARIAERAAVGPAPALVPALEIWTRVISRPEPDLAIVMMGKRDVSHDIDLPMARLWYREGLHRAPQPVEDMIVRKLSDQHGFLSVPTGADLAVGDLLGFDISHPCTTFDKWSVLMEVDEDYMVLGGLKTFF